MSEPLKQIERGWPAIKKAPFHFAGAVLALVAIGWLGIHFLYAKITEGKDATIEAKEAIIASKESTIDAKQKAVEAIQQTVSAKDELIVSLTNQFYKLMAFQEQLSSAQTNLLEQQKQLENVEYWVKNLYSQMTSEVISGSDSNRVVLLSATNDCVRVVFKLESIPIRGSLQLITTTPSLTGRSQQIIPTRVNSTEKNVFVISLCKYDVAQTEFTFVYVRDIRQTNLIQKIDAIDGVAMIDGKRLRINSN